MYQRQRNPRAHSAHIPETAGPDGEVLSATEVPSGGEVDWPYPLAGFDGWTEPDDAVEPEPEAEATSAETAPKSRTKAAKTASDTPEATA